MPLSRRRFIALASGGVVLAAAAGTGLAVTRTPQTATAPWAMAGAPAEPRLRALSWAVLAPNPHNRQPWIADLSRPGEVWLYADPARALPQTDPFDRQITIGLGCFVELLRMAAAADGMVATVTPFPEGEDAAGLDARPVARIVLSPGGGADGADPLFAHVPARRSLKEPFDTTRPLPVETVSQIQALAAPQGRFGGSVAPDDVTFWRGLTRQALQIEVETPHTFRESVDLFRIGHAEVDANPDGIDFSGPMMESLRLAGLFSRDSATDPSSIAFQQGMAAVMANADTAMGHLWLVTAGNSRADQLAAGADWLRVNLACTALGLGFQPLSQALQEFPEMAAPYAQAHETLAPQGGTVQMLARIGYGPTVGPSPRWPVETRLRNA